MKHLSGNRRTFLSWVSKLAITGLLGRTSLLYAGEESIPEHDVESAILEIIPSRESAAVIGREYLKYHPLESDTEILIDSLRTAKSGLRLTPSSGTRNLRDWVRSRIKEDFDYGDTVHVNRWILSRSEARLCALAALCIDQ